MRKNLKNGLKLQLSLCAFGLFVGIVACGPVQIQNGGGTAPQEARPKGAPISQGQFFGGSGQQVTGTASIFFTQQSRYLLRLEGLSLPPESGMKIKVYAHPHQKALQTPLRATTGDQNYVIIAAPSNFATVVIYSTQTRSVYATAQLSPTTQQ